MTIHLQGIGQVQAKQAADIKPGDVLMWNYGYTSTVTAILSQTPKSLVIKNRTDSGTYTRRLLKSTLVAIYWHDPLLSLAMPFPA